MKQEMRLFNEFMKGYLKNVKEILPESYRAQQYDEGGMATYLVIEFETKFLKEPFMKAIKKLENKMRVDFPYLNKKVMYIFEKKTKELTIENRQLKKEMILARSEVYDEMNEKLRKSQIENIQLKKKIKKLKGE